MERNKGITLIALIITIIILLILAGISLNLLIKGDLFGSAQKAVNGINEKIAEQQSIADELRKEFDENEEDGEQKNETGDQGTKQQETEKQETEQQETQEILPGTRVTKTTEYKVGDKTAVIPAGFTVSGISTEQSIETGLVIYDIPEGVTVDWTDPDSVRTTYNQFVWIPVSSVDNFGSSTWEENSETGGEKTLGTVETYSEPSMKGIDATTGIESQISELEISISQYGGFYIGRYEAGSTIARSESSSQTEEFVVQQDKYPYVYVEWGNSSSEAVTEGAVYLCNNLYSSTNTNYGATSMLCTGAAWDSTLEFIKDAEHDVTNSITWGMYGSSETYKIYRGSLYAVIINGTSVTTWSAADKTNGSVACCSLLTTGATERNSSKNIYDIAGNCTEWTTEAVSKLTNYRVIRGFGNDTDENLSTAAAGRSSSLVSSTVDVLSFRPILYVEL